MASDSKGGRKPVRDIVRPKVFRARLDALKKEQGLSTDQEVIDRALKLLEAIARPAAQESVGSSG